MSNFVRVSVCAIGALFFGIPFAEKGWGQQTAAEQPVVAQLTADSAWQELANATAAKPTAQRMSKRRNYSDLAERAKHFQATFPADNRVNVARRIEIEALLRGATLGGEIPLDLNKRIQEYITDPAVPAKDRFNISFLAKDAQFQVSPHADREIALRERARIAHELIREFPHQPGGYGYLLAVAKGHETSQARVIVEEILKSTAPAIIKAGAQRLLDRIEMEGHPFDMTALGLDSSLISGRVALIYSWSVREPHLLDQISRMAAAVPGVVLVGVNVDFDQEAAMRMAASKKIPGRQLYDGAGLDGAIACRLNLSMTSSILLVTKDGLVADVNAHKLTENDLRQVVEANGGQS